MLEQLPAAVRRAVGPFAAELLREAGQHVLGARVRAAAVEQIENVLAECVFVQAPARYRVPGASARLDQTRGAAARIFSLARSEYLPKFFTNSEARCAAFWS